MSETNFKNHFRKGIMGLLAIALWFFIGLNAMAKDSDVSLDTFEQELVGWSGWAPNESDL